MTFREDINGLARRMMRSLVTSHPKFDMRREHEIDAIYRALSIPRSIDEIAEETGISGDVVKTRLEEMRGLDLAQPHRVYWVRK